MAQYWHSVRAMKVTDLERLSRVRAMIESGEAKSRRSRSGLSLSEVASTCGVDGSTVWRWEHGLRMPRGATALKYCRVLDLLAPAAEKAS